MRIWKYLQRIAFLRRSHVCCLIQSLDDVVATSLLFQNWHEVTVNAHG
ncbi:hypothetical protein ANCCAN_06832 [Ancylostoma caninum]|uniref:Uncharacterized protein n=1 Tax=Ancylostoma caninum TaxID=29170 RepID=A0A368GUW5_ANCCA|nr:hypothetical protein ANCCAN_06832 [Ancylostoma caninum]